MSETIDLILDPPKHTCWVERTLCPFYGFNLNDIVMDDTKGNQCALKMEARSSCSMKISGKMPEWGVCTFYDWSDLFKDIEEMTLLVRVFPREFRPIPPYESFWHGFPLLWWCYYIIFEGT